MFLNNINYKNSFNENFLLNNIIYPKILKKKLIINYKINKYHQSMYIYSLNLKIKNTNYIDNYFFYKLFNANKNFINFFYNFCYYKNNFIILDNNYEVFFPIYKLIYGKNSLGIYKKYFFFNSINFTLKNWLYLYYKFCKYNNISLLFIFDYIYYSGFYNKFREFDFSLVGLIPYNSDQVYIDYPLPIFELNILIKITYSSFIYQIYSLALNNSNLYYQYKYILFFYKFINF